MHQKIDQQASEAVGGTLLSHEIYKYKCEECGGEHFIKEGESEICKRKIEL